MAIIEKAICDEYAYFDILGLGVYPQENQALIKYAPITIIENQENQALIKYAQITENQVNTTAIKNNSLSEKENLERDLQRLEPATGHQGLTKEFRDKSAELETGHQGLTKENKSTENKSTEPKKWYCNPFVILAGCAATVLTAGYLLRPTQETEKENTKKEEVSGLPKKLK